MLYWVYVNLFTMFYWAMLGDRKKLIEKYKHIFEGVLMKKSSKDKRRALLPTKTGFELIHLIIKFCFIHLS